MIMYSNKLKNLRNFIKNKIFKDNSKAINLIFNKNYKEKIYYFSYPNAMVDHTFTDDVAITIAKNKREAINNFKKLYSYSDDIFDRNVKILPLDDPNYSDPYILTDY